METGKQTLERHQAHLTGEPHLSSALHQFFFFFFFLFCFVLFCFWVLVMAAVYKNSLTATSIRVFLSQSNQLLLITIVQLKLCWTVSTGLQKPPLNVSGCISNALGCTVKARQDRLHRTRTHCNEVSYGYM